MLLHRGDDFLVDLLLAGGLERRLVEIEIRVRRERDLLRRRRGRRRRGGRRRRRRRLLRVADQVAEQRSEGGAHDRAPAGGGTGLFSVSAVASFVGVDQATGRAGSDGGADQAAGDGAAVPSPLVHGGATGQRDDSCQADRGHALHAHWEVKDRSHQSLLLVPSAVDDGAGLEYGQNAYRLPAGGDCVLPSRARREEVGPWPRDGHR